MASTVKPKAKETPRSPIPTSGKPAVITAEPQPPKVSQNVPIASATYFLVWSMVLGSCSWLLLKGRTTKSLYQPALRIMHWPDRTLVIRRGPEWVGLRATWYYTSQGPAAGSRPDGAKAVERGASRARTI